MRRFGQLHHSDIKSQHEVLTFELTYLNELTDQRNPFQVQLNCQKICVEKLTNRESIYKCFVIFVHSPYEIFYFVTYRVKMQFVVQTGI